MPPASPPAWPGDATGDYEHGQLADAVSVIELLDGAAVTKPMVSPRRTSPARRLLATTHLLHYCYHPLTLRTYLLLTPCYLLPTCHLQLEHSLAGGGVLTSDGLPQAPLAFYVVHEGRVTCPAAQRTFGRGDFFGHAEILQDKAGSQPVRRAEGGRAVLLTLTPARFYQLVPLHVLVKDSHEQAQ